MDCADVKKNCFQFLDKELDAEKTQAFEQHAGMCPPCAKLLAGQRSFHSFIKRACQTVAKTDLQKTVLEITRSAHPISVKASAKIQKVVPLRPQMNSAAAMAASFIFGLTGLIGYQSSCVSQQCPLVMAAKKEYAKIVAGEKKLETNQDPKNLQQYLGKQPFKLAKVSNLTLARCKLSLESCGPICVDGLGEGICLKYSDCHCVHGAVTILVMNTQKQPGGEPMNARGLIGAAYDGKHVLSWHEQENGPLYVLVTDRHLPEALECVELARK